MTKKTASGSGCTPLSLFYRSPRLMLGLSLFSGLSILSSGLVIAQTDSVGDKGTAPPSTTVKAASAPAPEPPAQRKQVVTTIVVPVTPAPSANREYEAPAPPPAPIAAKKPVAPSGTSETALKKPSTLRRSGETALKKPSTLRRSGETALKKPSTLRRSGETALRKPSTLRRSGETALRKPSTLRRSGETALRKPSTLRRSGETALRKPSTLRRSGETASRQPTTLQHTSETASRKPTTLQQTSETASRKPTTLHRTAAALGPSITVPNKPILAAPDLSLSDTQTVAKPPKVYLNPAEIQESAQAPDSPTNRYIDRTDYSIGATRQDDEPAPVMVTDRSTGCRTVSQNGQLVSGICDVPTPSQEIATQRTLTREIAKKQVVNREIANRQTASQQTDNSKPTVREHQLPRIKPPEHHLAKVTIHEPRLARVIVQDAQLPELTTRQDRMAGVRTREPQLTGVKRLPIASVAATEPVKLGPVKLRLRRTRQPRPRTYTAYSPQPQPVASLPASSLPVSEGWTSPTGLAYYNLTPRPEGRPNTSNANFMFPLAIPSGITSLFGWRIHPISGDYRFHAGTDIGAPEGTPVLAAIAGQVITADFMGGYGLTVVVQHEDGNNVSLYAHLSEIFVQPGDRVEQGNVLGRVGTTGFSTGPHLHFEWRHMTPNGWVALDARPNIEYAMTQLVKSLEVAQTPPQPESAPQQSVSQTAPQSTPKAVSQATEQVIPQSIPQPVPQATPQPISLRGL